VSTWRVIKASAALEAAQLRRNRAFVLLTALAAVSFLAMVSLFGLTGAFAPVALINLDNGPYATKFIDALNNAHHSFALKYLTQEEAQSRLHSGRLVGVLTIPEDFSEKIAAGKTVAIDIKIDNVNLDMTNDVQRALPAAIVRFGHENNFPGVRAIMTEYPVNEHDTGYIPYLVVSALALDAMVIAGILGAMATAREFERKTVNVLRLAPASTTAVLAGKLSISFIVASAALGITLLVIIFVYGVVPVEILTTIFALLACVAIFTSMGAWLGAVLKRTLAAVPLMFGLAMPFYIDSGALEPTRFDGETIWMIAHISPVYYAVGVLEWAFHGLRVTPEPVWVDLLVLTGTAILAVMLTLGSLSRGQKR